MKGNRERTSIKIQIETVVAIFLWRKVSLANRAQGIAADEQSLGNHEVGVASDTLLRLEPWDDVLQELNLGVGVSGSGEFGDPDLVHAVLVGKVDALRDMLLEVVGAISSAVPVDGHD